MLSTIDEENGIERGSTGHLVAVQLQAIDDIVPKLRSIVRNKKLDAHARFFALDILLTYFGYVDRRFFKSVLQTEPCADVTEALQWALDSTEKKEYRSMPGGLFF